MSPYNYCAGNPVKMMDPDGMSTIVVQNEDGTYMVTGGQLNGDNGIYCEGKLIGYSATPASFFNAESGEWMGKINKEDRSGSIFLNDLMNNLTSHPDVGGHEI